MCFVAVCLFVCSFSARAQLQERELKIVDLEKTRVFDTAQALREQKLVSSAFYSMGMEFQVSDHHRSTHHNTALQQCCLLKPP